MYGQATNTNRYQNSTFSACFFSDKITCLLTYNLRNAIIKVACNSIFKQSYFPEERYKIYNLH